MERVKSRLQQLRQKKRLQEITSQDTNSLIRNTSNDTEESVGPAKSTAAMGLLGGALPLDDPAPSTPEPKHYPQQSRDYEKTPTENTYAGPPSSNDGQQERVEPPQSTTRSVFHTLFGDATNAWIQSQASSSSGSPPSNHGERKGPPAEDSHEDKVEPPASPKEIPEIKQILSVERSYESTFEDMEDVNYSPAQQKEPEEILSVEPEHHHLGLAAQTDPPLVVTNPNVEDPPEIVPDEESIESIHSEEDEEEMTEGSFEEKVSGAQKPQGTLSTTSSFDSQETMQSEVEPLSRHFDAAEQARQRKTWVAFQSFTASSSSSGFSMDELSNVYIHDTLYSWVPAKVLEYHTEHAVVVIDPTESWIDSTVLDDEEAPSVVDLHSSMEGIPKEDINRLKNLYGLPVSQLRKVSYIDYENGDLPCQSKGEGKRDMADLVALNPAAILYNLKDRHFHKKPYTRVGDIVIAINPCTWIKELYSPSNRDLYSKNLIWDAQQEKGKLASELSMQKSIYDRLGFEPHVYEVSSLAYRGLATTGKDQTILVTGESGAGKTESVKIVMNHLATIQKTRPGGVPTEHSTAKEIVKRVLQSSPVFEAFGNAKTVRNNNSSRFGKFMQMQFQLETPEAASLGGREVPYTDLVGTKCTTYLLEKNRVVNHDQGERSFHVFYQLLAAPQDLKEFIWPAFADRTADDYSFTAGETGDIVTDAAAWEETVVALETFQFRKDSLKMLLQALIIVLQLGNLMFDHDPKDNEEHNTIVKNKKDLTELSELIGIDASELEESMTSRLLKTRGHDDIKVKLSPQVAKESSDALAKEIYARIFDVLVQKINTCTAYPEFLQNEVSSYGHVSLLDIFGFERFDVNRFEQLCINYANERLHHKYILDNFLEVKDEYDAEGVDLYDFGMVDNSDVLDLLEGKSGLLASLSEECMRPKGNAESFVYKAKRLHKGSRRLVYKKLHQKLEFGIAHFTGTVEYNAHDFVGRNVDSLPNGLIECAAKSQNTLIEKEFKVLLSDRLSEGDAGKHSNKKSSKRTVLQKFQTQLKSLLVAMESTKTRYIRCIKPNASMTPRKTCHKSTMAQLECSGIMTALTISRDSFPNKLGYSFILDRYSCLMIEKDFEEHATMETRDKVQHILTKWLRPLSRKSRDGMRTMPFACGKTKVFFKAGSQDKLEELRMQHFDRGAVIIQAWTRKQAAINSFDRTIKSIQIVQSFGRMIFIRSKFLRRREASTTISAWIRGRWCAAMLVALYKQKAATTIQKNVKSLLTRSEYRTKCKAALIIQLAVRNENKRAALRATLKSLAEQARMKSSLSGLGNAKSLDQLDGEEEKDKHSGEIEQMFGYLRSDIESLRAENDALKAKLESADTEHHGLMLKTEDANATVSNYRSRVQDLVKANDSLVKEVYRVRQETSKAKRKLQSDGVQIESKLTNAEKELHDMKCTYESELKGLKDALRNSEKELADEREANKHETLVKKQKYDLQRQKMKDDLKRSQESHQQYLSKLMDVLETTYTMKQQESAMMTTELSAVRKERDEQILRLQQEVKALQVLKRGGLKNVRAALDPRSLKRQLGDESDLRSRRSAQFDDVVQTLQSLVTGSCALPSCISEKDMAIVIEQQERGQKMTEMLEGLGHLYKMEEDSQYKTSQTSFSLIEEYVALTEPNRTMMAMRVQMDETNLDVSRLEEELRNKEFCKRCAVRDSIALRRING